MTTDTLLIDVTSEALANVNILSVVFLMCIGFLIKHWKVLDKIENELIVPVLLVASFVISFIENNFSMSMHIATTALCTAVTAIGLHQSGKNIFTQTIIPKVKELIEANFIPLLVKYLKGNIETKEEENKDDVE